MTHRLPLFFLLIAILSACGLEHIDAILAKYDTFGETGTTAGTETSTGAGSTRPDSSGSESSSTTSASTGGEAGLDASGNSSDTGTTATELASTSTSTGPAPPVCGDGHLDPGETCDDMNDDPADGCKLCAKDLTVFVTSEIWQGGKLGGLFLADQRCRMLAALANLPNFATYRAWLSDSTHAAAERIFHSPGRYVLVNGLVVADDWDGLTSGKLQNPINVTEASQTTAHSRAWTGTLASGQPALGATFCDDWTALSNGQLGGDGIVTQTDELWTFLEQDDCGSESALYCFEQPPT